LGLGVITATWLGISYLTGRYSPENSGEQRSILGSTGKTLLARAGVIAVFIGHSWLYDVTNAQTRFRGFLIPLIGSTFILSTFGHALWTGFLERRVRWVLLGNRLERETIGKELSIET